MRRPLALPRGADSGKDANPWSRIRTRVEEGERREDAPYQRRGAGPTSDAHPETGHSPPVSTKADAGPSFRSGAVDVTKRPLSGGTMGSLGGVQTPWWEPGSNHQPHFNADSTTPEWLYRLQFVFY